MVPSVISHYEILDKLGEGGMGVVYKARDTELDRIVALKFLPQHLTTDESEQLRFLQEAKAASALNHPNVCSIHSIGTHEGERFIDMELVDGQTLRSLIADKTRQAGGKGFRIGEAMEYAIQIGDALQEAHSKGIIHRDIKTENIMVNARNQIKVMDFGLAKLKGSLRLTRTSSTLGTLAYMAPEQLQGSDVDARADIFSYGVVLYEMLTGRLPFRGEHEAAMMYSILNEQPAPLLTLRPDVPEELDRIVQRSLEKDPADRYQHVDDMVSDLRRAQKQSARIVRPQIPQEALAPPPASPAGETARPSPKRKLWIGLAGGLLLTVVAATVLYRTLLAPGGGSVSSRKMVAVLPFENLGSADQEYFADGITEEITSKLSGLSGLGVIARSSAMQYKKTTKTLKQIGQELGVTYILQGTIRWENVDGLTHVRVNPQLISVGDETQLWSQPSEAVLAGAFKLQSEIASKVASALNVTLLTQERQTLESKPTENAEAYDFYLRGNEYAFRSVTEQDIRLAVQMYQRAVTLDPKFAAAYSRLSEEQLNLYWEFYDRSDERLRQARAAAEKAVDLDASSPDAHAAMAWNYYHGLRDYDNALKEFTLALQAQPNNADVILGIGSVYRRQGNFEEAAVRIQRAVEINPRWSGLSNELAATYTYLRRYADADRLYDRSLALAPEVSLPYEEKAWLLIVWKGDVDGARRVIQDAGEKKVGADDPTFLLIAARVEILGGAYQHALDMLTSSHLEVLAQQFWYIPKSLAMAEIYGYLHQSEQARRQFNAARILLEKNIQLHPDDSRLHSALGIAYAGLGRNDDAVREGKRGVEILPLTKDGMIAPVRMEDLARIYTILGEQEAAIDILQQLLTIPSSQSASLLKLDPAWEGLRGNPRFQRLIAGKDVQ